MRVATLLVCLLLAPAANALSQTLVITGGAALVAPKISTATDGSLVTVGPMRGPHLQLGLELGEHFTNRFSFIYSNASGPAKTTANPDLVGSASVSTFAAGYQLAYDFLGKGPGLSAYFGAGVWVGRSAIHTQVTQGTFNSVQDGSITMLELHVVGGLRYVLPTGLGFCAEVLYSTYGGFLGTIIPQVGVTWHLG